MNQFAKEHARKNRSTQDSWEVFAPHREHVTHLILSAKDPLRRKNDDDSSTGGRLCVLGAGNSNDLDLARLANAFENIDLIDLDPVALAEGVAHQLSGSESASNIKLYGNVDLTGLYEQLIDWSPESQPADKEISELIAEAASAPIQLPSATYDGVVSACLLTQLIDSLKLAMAETHPRFNELLLAVRDRHLRLLAEAIAPGGFGLLITDFVSSDTCPELATLSDAEVAQRAGAWLAAGNFFSGVNPAVLQARFQEDEALRSMNHTVEISQPWRWSLGSRRYAVCALLLR